MGQIDKLQPGGALHGRLFAEMVRDLTAPRPLPRDTLIGGYRLLAPICRHSASVVYRALAIATESPYVALELAYPLAHKRSAFQRQREALRNLEHPAIVRVLDGGETNANEPWRVTELIDATRIDDWCAAHQADWRLRIALILQACRALSYAHERNLVHGDIKASNVLVDAGGRVHLQDFATAPLLVEGTQLGRNRGATDDRIAITAATDILLVGRLIAKLLFDTEGIDAAGRRISGPNRRNLSAVVERATQCLRDERYADMAAMIDDLERVLATRPAATKSWSPAFRALLWIYRSARRILGGFRPQVLGNGT